MAVEIDHDRDYVLPPGERPPESWFEEIEGLLAFGRIEIRGTIIPSSNRALLVEVEGPRNALAVYKPARLARPLWDFDRDTLHLRERAAYLVAKALGWLFVPPTVLRDGPLGNGSVQLCIDAGGAAHYYEFADDPGRLGDLLRLRVFDLVINNADRKAGHCILDSSGRLWSIDHGTCFHYEEKLRTVIRRFGDSRIPPEILADLGRLRSYLDENAWERTGGFREEISRLLSPIEVEALRERIEALVRSKRFPESEEYAPEPWPPI